VSSLTATRPQPEPYRGHLNAIGPRWTFAVALVDGLMRTIEYSDRLLREHRAVPQKTERVGNATAF
jgi:hypothetical protein